MGCGASKDPVTAEEATEEKEELLAVESLLGLTRGGKVIQLYEDCEWSHVAMCADPRRNPLSIRFLKRDDGHLSIVEASTNVSGLKDLETGKVLRGVETVDFHQKVFAPVYKSVAVRHWQGVDGEVAGRPYEEDMIELFKAAYDGPGGLNEENLSSLFCSEFVAAALQHIGFLGKDLPSNEYTPKDFSTDATNSPNWIIEGFSLGPVRRIDLDAGYDKEHAWPEDETAEAAPTSLSDDEAARKIQAAVRKRRQAKKKEGGEKDEATTETEGEPKEDGEVADGGEEGKSEEEKSKEEKSEEETKGEEHKEKEEGDEKEGSDKEKGESTKDGKEDTKAEDGERVYKKEADPEALKTLNPD